MAINIYSLEELCYYVYNNIYLIGLDLFDEGLTNYIRNELEESELADQMDFLIEHRAGLSEMVTVLLRGVDYYSEEDIMQLKDVIDKLDMQNASERLKSRADNFLSNERYLAAIRNYEMIAYGRRDINLKPGFYGDIWHNMGVAYARMFDFEDAMTCFKYAYELGGDDSSYRAYHMAGSLMGMTEMEDEEQAYMAQKEIETLMDHVTLTDEYEPVLFAKEKRAEGDLNGYHDSIDHIIDDWKTQYRRYIK